MTARLGRRLERVAAAVGGAGGGRFAQAHHAWREKVWAERRQVLDRIDEDLQSAILAALAEMDRTGIERPAVARWVSDPVTAGHGVTLPDRFPRAYVEFLLTDPDVFFGHDCGQCGLSVPIWLVRDTRHTADGIRERGGTLIIYRTCPARGGKTGYSAYYHAYRAGPP